MTVGQAIEYLQKLPIDKLLLAQVVAEDGGAWNMQLSINDVSDSSYAVVTLSHPELKTMPKFK